MILVFITRREPARHQGVGPRLRVPDVRLHRRWSRALVFFGLTKSFFGWFGGIEPIPFDRVRRRAEACAQTGGTLGVFLLLKGFSSGAVALTGVEAISNGVPAFRRPESKNAATTLAAMAIILGTLFLGVSVLAHHLQPYPSEQVTVFAQMGKQVFGDNFIFWILQLATAGILTLAANTAYADFPRLSSIIARDGYLPAPAREPRRPARVLERRARARAAWPALLIVVFGGKTNALIPLYAVGVFISFTLSQAGMVRHHQKEREPHWKRNAVINGVGCGRDRDRRRSSSRRRSSRAARGSRSSSSR